MDKSVKKYMKSKVAIVCYLLAAAMLVYACYQIGNTVHTINEYYSQYEMKATFAEYLTYTMQNALTPLINAVVMFMLAYILDAVRKNNPANWMSQEEIEEKAIAKKEAREAKQFAKGEKAAAKAGFVTTDEKSVEADFTESLKAELSAGEADASADAPKPRTARKPRKPAANRQNAAKGQNKDGEGSQNSGKGSEGTQNQKNSDGKQNRSGEGGQGGNRKPRNNSSKGGQNKNKNAEAKNDVKSENKNEAKGGAKAETKNEAKNEPKAEAKKEAKNESKAEAKKEAKNESKAEAKVEAKNETKPEHKSETKPEPKNEAKEEPKEERSTKFEVTINDDHAKADSDNE